MRRRRLSAPAVAFVVIGSIGLIFAASGVPLRGGLVALGLYVVALQCAVSGLLLVAIDDTRDPRVESTGKAGRWRTRANVPADGTFRLASALWRFHLREPLPAGLLAAGLSMSLSLIAIPSLDRHPGAALGHSLEIFVRRSELALGSLLVLTVLLTVWQRGVGRYGWIVGFAAGVVVSQLAIDSNVDIVGSVGGWLLSSVALSACCALFAFGRRLLLRRAPVGRADVKPA